MNTLATFPIISSMAGAGTLILGVATLWQVIKGNQKTTDVQVKVNGYTDSLAARNVQLVKVLSENGIPIPSPEESS